MNENIPECNTSIVNLQSFIAGLLKYAPEMACLTNPTVNSYKRLVPDAHSPCHIAWAEINRSLAVRVPVDISDGRKVEFRTPDPSSNPYLALAACVKAGLKGIEEGLKPPAKIETNVYALPDGERERLGIKSMPQSLKEAVGLAQSSDFIKELLGEELCERYLMSKLQEYEEYRRNVDDWEIKRYLIKY